MEKDGSARQPPGLTIFTLEKILGKIPGQPGKDFRRDFIAGKLCYILQGRARAIAEQRACSVVAERIQLGFSHRLLNRVVPADIPAKEADVDLDHPFPDQHHGLARQHQSLFSELILFVESGRTRAAVVRRKPRGGLTSPNRRRLIAYASFIFTLFR